MDDTRSLSSLFSMPFNNVRLYSTAHHLLDRKFYNGCFSSERLRRIQQIVNLILNGLIWYLSPRMDTACVTAFKQVLIVVI